MKNLVASASPDYLLFDPDSQSPGETITYGLDDAVADANTSVTVEIFTSSQQPVTSDTFTTSTGTGKTYTWNGKNSSGVLQPRGVYLYRISASQAAQGDSDCDKSPWSITSTSLETVERLPTVGDSIVRVGYYVATEPGCGALTASSASVTAYDPDLSPIASQSATGAIATNQMNYFPDFEVLMDEGGVYTYLVSAWDDHRAHDRNHFNRNGGVRPLLQNNKTAVFTIMSQP